MLRALCFLSFMFFVEQQTFAQRAPLLPFGAQRSSIRHTFNQPTNSYGSFGSASLHQPFQIHITYTVCGGYTEYPLFITKPIAGKEAALTNELIEKMPYIDIEDIVASRSGAYQRGYGRSVQFGGGR